MDDDSVALPAPMRKKPTTAFYIVQSAFVLVPLFILLILFGHFTLLWAANAIDAQFWSFVGFASLAAVLSIPTIFLRLPLSLRVVLYVGIVTLLVLMVDYSKQVETVYVKSPAGQRERAPRTISQREVDDSVERLVHQVRAERALAEANAAQEEVQSNRERAEDIGSCLGWSGKIRPVVEAVKEHLHNPGAFEHVSTSVIGPDPDGMNVEMTFRAENGFGAIRTGTVRAKVSPHTCKLLDLGSLDVD